MNSNDSVRSGFVFGELLVALLLLAVAVSSLAALMYSVSRHPQATTPSASAKCVAANAARGSCVPPKEAAPVSSKLLRSGCATRSVFDQRSCKDTVSAPEDETPDGVRINARTDSAAMAILTRKQKAQEARVRSDRGFIR